VKLLKIATLMAMMLMIAAPFATAGTCASACKEECCETATITVDGQSRYRLNLDGPNSFDFDSDTDPVWFSEMRTRIGVKAVFENNAGVYFQMQDSRTIGNDPGTEAFNNGTFESGVHQAFMWYQPCNMGWLKVGRFEMNEHNQRLVGAVGWSNVGRTFEGIKFGRALNDNIELSGWATQLNEQFDTNLNIDGDPAGDDMFYGLNIAMKDRGVDVFAYMNTSQYDGMPMDASMITLGAFSHRTFGGNFDYESMFAYQMGTMDDGTSEMDIAAMMFFAELGYTLDNGLRFAGLIDYTSGDDDMADDEYKAFSNLYYTGHKFRGAMDFWLADEVNGLMDLAARVQYPVNDSWKVMGDFHMFSAAQDVPGAFTASGNDETNYGTEIDLAAKYCDGAFSWVTGFSMASQNEDMSGDTDSQNWIYSMATVNF